MNRLTKYLFIICPPIFIILTLLFTGCTQAPSQPEPVAPVTTPDTNMKPPTETAQIAPMPATGSSFGFEISKAPKVGETVDLTFTLDITGNIKPVTRVWLEFERYDPAVFYPLGRGRGIERWLELLSKQTTPESDYAYLTRAAGEQPVSLVSPASVVLTGDNSWQGEPLKKGDQVLFKDRVRFPEEGEWLVSAKWQVEGGPAYVMSELYLTVTESSGTIRWPKDYSTGNVGHLPTSLERPVGVFIRTPRAPLVGEPVLITITAQSIEDLDEAEVFLRFRQMQGYKSVEIPLSDVIVEGEGTWQGSLKKGVPVQFSCVVRFPTEGDWQIAGVGRASPSSYAEFVNRISFHVDKEKSRFGWPVNHQKPFDDPLRPR